MRFKKISLIFLSIMIIIFSSTTIYAKEGKKIAVIYDFYGEYGASENKLSSIVNMILETGCSVDIISVGVGDNWDFNTYNGVVILYNQVSKLPDRLLTDISEYKGNLMWIGKNFEQATKLMSPTATYQGNLKEASFLQEKDVKWEISSQTFIPVFNDKEEKNKSEIKYLALEKEIPFWIGYKNIKYVPYFSYNDVSYAILKKEMYKMLNYSIGTENRRYLLIDKVFPFMDLKEFVGKIDFLHNNGLSFVCSVMPIYDNANFDAMKRFCEVLKYAQDMGGRVILHYPELFGENIPGEKVEGKMEVGAQNYIAYGVYPLAIDIPEAFFYKEDYKNLIRKSDTVFTNKYEKYSIITGEKFLIDSYKNVIEKVDIKDKTIPELAKLNYNTAISINADLDLESFKKTINNLINKDIIFNNLNNLDMSINFKVASLKSNGENIFLNNKSVYDDINLEQNQTKSEKHVGEKKDNMIDLTNASSIIVYIGSFVTVIFFVIIFISAKIDKRKYFK